MIRRMVIGKPGAVAAERAGQAHVGSIVGQYKPGNCATDTVPVNCEAGNTPSKLLAVPAMMA